MIDNGENECHTKEDAMTITNPSNIYSKYQWNMKNNVSCINWTSLNLRWMCHMHEIWWKNVCVFMHKLNFKCMCHMHEIWWKSMRVLRHKLNITKLEVHVLNAWSLLKNHVCMA
jgi:hypothetical protein